MNEHPTTLLAAYNDGELSNGEMAALSSHVRACPACQRQVQDFRALSRLLQERDALPPFASATAFWQQLAPQLPHRRPALGFAWVWGLLMLLVAGVSQAILTALGVTGVAETLGFSPLAPLQRQAGAWLGPANPVDTALRLLGDSTLAGWALDSPLAALVPYLLILLLTAAVTLSFLGWGLAALHQSRRAAAGS